MAKELLPNALWARIAPLHPPEPPKLTGRRTRVSDQAALTGILLTFLLLGCALIPVRFLG